ncbi:ROK family transcriptional regulator [Spongiactinospora sp. TRM90649]|uniref:ROK family transcriptional regulator n=1 Tax=Spongiactinospora sp. TRM90649 TaxID=3031114 RepID=UPI0023F8E831|nr:ROK family transcriptional regulator [Spongiactinospora sp. TRM90649]MDF5753607.1 ROK family transcriptional regulator [Spongiactinospora sp. TRM90649]
MTDGLEPPAVARPQLMREMNTQVVVDLLRRSGPLSRTDLGRLTGLSKPTVQQALAGAEKAGLVTLHGHRQGLPGPAAKLYKIDIAAGHVLALDVGHEYLRGAVCDLTGEVYARRALPVQATSARGRVAEVVDFGRSLLAIAELPGSGLRQTVLGSPGFYDPRRDALTLTGGLEGWDSPDVLAALRAEFGASMVIENDVDLAAVAEHAAGHAQGVDNVAFVSIGTGVGVGLIINGRLHRGAHGAAGEVAFLPFPEGGDAQDARRRGSLEAAASAAGVVRSARALGVAGSGSAQDVFDLAQEGVPAAAAAVASEADLVAKVLTTVIVVLDPALIVVGGGIGQAPGFLSAVVERVRELAPVMPRITSSALGRESVVDGALSLGVDRAWTRLLGEDGENGAQERRD